MTASGEQRDLDHRLRVLEDLQAIHQLFIDYGDCLDSGDIDGYAQCFTEDAELLLGPLGTAKGREAIATLMRQVTAGLVGRSFHLITNPRVRLDGDDATAVVMWSVVTRGDDGAPHLAMLGRHEDELVRDGSQWRFRRRKGLIDLPSRYPARQAAGSEPGAAHHG
jgi:uncharacterized protein (TIGR02246 family)